MKIPALSSNAIDRVQFIGQLRGRAKLLHGTNASRVQSYFDKQYNLLTSTADRETAMAKHVELITASRAGNAEATSQLQAIRIETVQNFLLASSNAMSFFEVIDLASDEVPYIQNHTRNEINVTYMGADGRPRKVQAIKQQQEQRVDLRFFTTDEYEYPLVDPYRGEVKEASLAQINVADDFNKQLSKQLWPYIQGTIGNFGLTGKKQSRVYVPHSTIVVGNLPTTNALIPLNPETGTTDNTATSLWRKTCMDAVLKYCAAWGSEAFIDGAIVPAAVYVPSLHVMGWLDQVTLTNFPNTVVEQIFENGFVISYGGNVKWALIGDTQLDPANKTAYIRTNKHVGKFFTKTKLDEVIIDDSKAMKIQNKESMQMKKLIGVGLPSPWNVNAMAVQYRS